MPRLLPLVLTVALLGCPPPPELHFTAAELSGFEATTTYDAAMAYLESQRDFAFASSQMHLTTFGESFEGRPLPLVVIGADSSSAGAVLATGKPRLFLFANIHAGEVAGKEALLEFVRDHWKLVYGREDLVMLIAPIYNADGNERVALDNRPYQLGPVEGMGQRANAQGLDLNRDFVKVAAPETRALLQLFEDYDPHVVVDLHTTNGTQHAYHLTYSPPLSPNTAPALDELVRQQILPVVRDSVRARTGYEIFDYGNVPGAFGEPATRPRGWYTFDGRPRFSTNYVGLRNRIGILSEAYSYATFEDRVEASLAFVTAIADAVVAHGDRIQALTDSLDAEAEQGALLGQPFALRIRHVSEGDTTILMGDTEEIPHPTTGEPMRSRLDEVTPEVMPAFTRFEATETNTLPAAYVFPRNNQALRDLLDAHGITWGIPREGFCGPAEGFRIDSVKVLGEFQQRDITEVTGAWEPVEGPVAGVVVPMTQPLARLAFTILEPRSDDGAVAWNVLGDALQEGTLYPVLRIPDEDGLRSTMSGTGCSGGN
ncbi:MAG: M14 family metallopeptidase [Bacteroidota bacterium]